MTIGFEDFLKVDIRAGRIIGVSDFPEAKRPAYKLEIDFGPDIGIKKSSAQITDNYGKADLDGRLVMAVVNFPPKQIGPFLSEVLVLGFTDAKGAVALAAPEGDVPPGRRLH